MAKYYGEIGYLVTQEKYEDGRGTGIWEETIVPKNYYGDQVSSYSRWQAGTDINDNIVSSVQLSIVADDFAKANFMFIKYAMWYGQKWKVEKAEPQFPRVLLTLGGLYNGPEDGSSG